MANEWRKTKEEEAALTDGKDISNQDQSKKGDQLDELRLKYEKNMNDEQSKLQFQIDFCHEEIEDVQLQLERD